MDSQAVIGGDGNSSSSSNEEAKWREGFGIFSHSHFQSTPFSDAGQFVQSDIDLLSSEMQQTLSMQQPGLSSSVSGSTLFDQNLGNILESSYGRIHDLENTDRWHRASEPYSYFQSELSEEQTRYSKSLASRSQEGSQETHQPSGGSYVFQYPEMTHQVLPNQFHLDTSTRPHTFPSTLHHQSHEYQPTSQAMQFSSQNPNYQTSLSGTGFAHGCYSVTAYEHTEHSRPYDAPNAYEHASFSSLLDPSSQLQQQQQLSSFACQYDPQDSLAQHHASSPKFSTVFPHQSSSANQGYPFTSSCDLQTSVYSDVQFPSETSSISSQGIIAQRQQYHPSMPVFADSHQFYSSQATTRRSGHIHQHSSEASLESHSPQTASTSEITELFETRVLKSRESSSSSEKDPDLAHPSTSKQTTPGGSVPTVKLQKMTTEKISLTSKQVRPHACPVGNCKSRFKRADELSRHMRMHTGSKPHVCSKCRKQFSRRDHLHTHERTHTGERPYQCHLCLKRFTRSDELKRHMKVHSKPKKPKKKQ